MKCQLFVVVASLMGALIVSDKVSAQNRTAQRTVRPTYTYRPVTKPAIVAARPAAAPVRATTAQPVSASVAPRPATATTSSSVISRMLARNNQIRASRGMRPMFLSSRLTAAAQSHANYMARTGGFSHYTNGGPQGRAAAYGFRGGVRENIAMGQGSVDSAFAVWTASGGHYANMMSHSDVAGFGYAVGANGAPYWVAVYARNDGGN